MLKALEVFYRTRCNVTLIAWSDYSNVKNNNNNKSSCLALLLSRNRVEKVKITSKFKFRYALNAVTFSYSFTRWDWARWERELDWLALRGVNLCLASTGSEYVFYNVFLRLFQIDLVETYFTSETYFAWNRMGNIQRASREEGEEKTNMRYLREQFHLQEKILHRMLELGIHPIFSAFNGFIPRELKEPNQAAAAEAAASKQDTLSLWSGFDASASNVNRLASSSGKFATIGKEIITETLFLFSSYFAAKQREEGIEEEKNTFFFSLDVYNENQPKETEDEFPALAKNLYSPIASVMKGKAFKIVTQLWFIANDQYYWTKSRAIRFINSFPKNSLLLLDLHGDRCVCVLKLP